MRLRPLLLAAAVVLTAVGVPHAAAEYPDVCFPAVDGLPESVLVATSPSADRAVEQVVARAGGRVGPRFAPLGVRNAILPSAARRDAVLAALRALPGVRWAETEKSVHVNRTPNDPLARTQWAIGKIGLRQAWDVTTGSASVTVAVIDTGVAANHPDLKGQVLPGVDVVNGDEDASDDQGHGTHVAGTIAAASNNRKGVAGVAWGVKVLPVKVLNDKGSGGSCDVMMGLVEAVDNGASVLNLSLGMASTCPLAFRAALQYVDYKKAVVVASSGNDAAQGGPNSAPADCPGVLGVGATDSSDKPGVFSTFGAYTDVSAPGVDILSTTIDPKTKKLGYGALSGTSMAAPHVAGLAALIRSKHPDWTPQQVIDAIVQTSVDLGVRGRDDFYGVGRINAAKALAR